MSISIASGAGCIRAASLSSRRLQVGGERVGADAGPLGDAALRALVAVGDEVHLHLGVGSDDGADVAALDHDVAVAPELALPLAHHLAHGVMARDDGDHPVDARLADRGVTSVPAIQTRSPR